jgi:hypothetical protein
MSGTGSERGPGTPGFSGPLEENPSGVYIANGVAEVIPDKPFLVRVINTSTWETKLSKGMILGHALPHSKGIVSLVEEDDQGRFMPDPRMRAQDRVVAPADEVAPADRGPFVSGKEPQPLPDRPDVLVSCGARASSTLNRCAKAKGAAGVAMAESRAAAKQTAGLVSTARGTARFP